MYLYIMPKISFYIAGKMIIFVLCTFAPVFWFVVLCVFWFCAMFVAVVQRVCKFWLCAVFEVMGGGGKTGAKPCGANTRFFKKEKIFEKRKNLLVMCLVFVLCVV